jgi:hypothetical protein
MLRPAWTAIFLFFSSVHVAEMTGRGHHAKLLLVEMGSHEIFPGQASKCDPLDLCLMNNKDYRGEPPCLV